MRLAGEETSPPKLGKGMARREKRLGRIVQSGTDPGNRGVVSEGTPPKKQKLKIHGGSEKQRVHCWPRLVWGG
jgi:hypothetical protein